MLKTISYSPSVKLPTVPLQSGVNNWPLKFPTHSNSFNFPHFIVIYRQLAQWFHCTEGVFLQVDDDIIHPSGDGALAEIREVCVSQGSPGSSLLLSCHEDGSWLCLSFWKIDFSDSSEMPGQECPEILPLFSTVHKSTPQHTPAATEECPTSCWPASKLIFTSWKI